MTALCTTVIIATVAFIILFKPVTVSVFYESGLCTVISGELLALEIKKSKKKKKRRRRISPSAVRQGASFVLRHSELSVRALPCPSGISPTSRAVYDAVISIFIVYAAHVSGKLILPWESPGNGRQKPLDLELTVMPITLIFASLLYKFSTVRSKGT